MRLVWEMMKILGQRVPPVPTPLDADTVRLRVRLIEEEVVEELLPALGKVKDQGPGTREFEKVVDGCCDGIVVLAGTLLAMGVAVEEALYVVCEDNIAKFKERVALDSLGKGIKPEGWPGPEWKFDSKINRDALLRSLCSYNFEHGSTVYFSFGPPGEYDLGLERTEYPLIWGSLLSVLPQVEAILVGIGYQHGS